MNDPIFRIPLGKWIEAILSFLTDTLSGLTKAISAVIESAINVVVGAVLVAPPWLFILLASALIFWLVGRKIALFSLVGLFILWNLNLWEPTIITIALVLVSTIIAVALGIPMGIVAALSPPVNRVLTPILDFMQTMPAFVYLIPAIPFFGLGSVSAVFATVIFSIPPAIRLTSLGINQVPADLVEAGDAFGATRMQKLFKVQLPIAQQTILAGVNQTIMLALSMAVIAAMIGAGGLGGEVWKAIQRLKPGMGFEAGVGVVIVAMILDRITQNLGKRNAQARKLH